MINKILMPSGGQTTDEMVILKWSKSIGDFVKRGDILFEIETDKAILTVESFAEGTLLDIKYPEGQMVKTGEVVAHIGNPEDKLTQEKGPVESKKMAVVAKSSNVQVIKTTPANTNPAIHKVHENRLQASPLAKNRAKSENIKLQDVARYFAKNLLKKIDVDNYIASTAVQAQEEFYFIDAGSMRKTIAKRMTESVQTSPHYIVSIDVDMGESIALRNRLNSNDRGIKISFNDIIIKVAAKAIESQPLINATYQEDRIKVYKDVNFGLAVALESGLIVPVIKGVNRKSIGEIAVANKENIEKAKNSRLHERDISGGTITLSSLGAFGVSNFTAIINQPESCILAVGSIIAKTVVVNRQMVICDMMNITASFDHRIIDGAIGAAFLKEVKNLLENPQLLLL
jgi:pyruvate dehydrogenase E2 component (dihydrolipoamide acetyltransferase)